MAQRVTISKKERKQLISLATFLPILTAPDFSFGAWKDCVQLANGTWMLTHFEFSAEAKRFFDATYDLGCVDLEFDWIAWSTTEEARSHLDDHRLIGTATPEQLRKLLTMSVRMDRYCEGSLAGDFESGLLLALMRRAAALAS
ncbi:MAG: DUF6508 domain-containing protein [Alsobacter sp.]